MSQGRVGKIFLMPSGEAVLHSILCCYGGESALFLTPWHQVEVNR